MATKQFDNSGILFRNESKDPDNEKDRDFGGSATVAGVEYWLSGWVKTGQRGKFLTLSLKPKEDKAESFGSKKKSDKPEFSDEIPF